MWSSLGEQSAGPLKAALGEHSGCCGQVMRQSACRCGNISYPDDKYSILGIPNSILAHFGAKPHHDTLILS